MSDTEGGSTWRGVGDAISDARAKAGLSAVQLSNRTRDLGIPIHRVAISKIEAGERDMTVSELIVLAVALDTAPVMLLFPGPYGSDDQNGRVLPDMVMTKFDAAQWVSGLLDRPTPAPGTNFFQYRANLKALREARIIDELKVRQTSLLRVLADYEGDDSREAEAIRHTLTQQLAAISDDIARSEGEEHA
ncbi:MAG: helix-turn-helix transcriptional regulator [Mycobacterium sp.]|nr:helix-turn-helix transcriptional regulator [Mycobacterium sp.]